MNLRAIIMIIIVCVFVGVAFAGCSKDIPPPFVTTAQPELPAECLAPSTREPRLRDGDITAEMAARDRNDLKWAYRNERNLRATCAARLQAQRGEKP